MVEPRHLLLALLLTTPVLAGCLGTEDPSGLNAQATKASQQPPAGLPPDLEMQGAEVVSYTDTTVVWRWEATLGPGQWYLDGPASNAARTTFDVPAGLGFAVEANATRYDDGASQLGVTVETAEGEQICAAVEDGTIGNMPVACAAPSPALASRGTWTVVVDTTASAAPSTPFTLLLTLTTGAADPSPVRTTEAPREAAASTRSHAVIGFADTGINPYHEAFRDTSAEAHQHPGTYLEGFPEDARALELTLDASTYLEAIAADADRWASVQPGQLYWIPGTRIVGAILPQAFVLDLQPAYFCQPVLDCYGHGTGVASRGAADPYGTCPSCKIVAVQGFTPGFEWLADQPWVDVSSNSWIEGFDVDENVGQRAEDDARIARKPTFFVSGNGLGGHLGVAGQPTTTWSHAGAPHVYAVGGHDNGRVTPWTGTLPHLAADVCTFVARHKAASGFTFGCGTSYSTPYAAGAAAQLVLQARSLLGDDRSGIRSGTLLAQGAASGIDGGPLEDGNLTLHELRRLLLATADPRPGATEDGGPACDAAEHGALCVLGATAPVAWQDVPEDVPAYYWLGYGGVDETTIEHAGLVMIGEEPVPERPLEDALGAFDQEVREALMEVDP